MRRVLHLRRPAVFVFCLSLACGLFTLWPFLAHHGIPVYQHDWSWSPYPVRFRDGLLQLVSTWNEEGLGHANPFATANPISIATVAAGAIFPPKAGLVIVLAIICVTGGTGIWRLSRHLSGSDAAAALAVFVYLASPVFFNKTSAGQLGYLEAYALFPWTVFCTIRAIETGAARWYAATALFAGLECLQPQFFVYGVLQGAVFAIALWRRRGIAVLGVIAVAEVALNLPAVFATMTLQAGYRFTIPHPVARFEYLQSAAFSDAVRLVGYIIPYATAAYQRVEFGQIAFALLWIVPTASVLGLVLRVRDAYARGALLLAACGVLLAMGDRGPLAGFLAWGFAHVSAMTLLREFYHSSVLTSCAFAIGTALALAALRNKAVRVALAAVYIAALLPLAVGGHSADLHFASPHHDDLAARAYIAGGPAGRVLPYPYKMPLALGGASTSGVDVFGYVDREHMLASEYGATPEMDMIAALLADGHKTQAQEWLQRYGVRYVVWRKSVNSAFPGSLMEPEERRYERRAQRLFNGSADAYERSTAGVRCFGETCVGIVPGARPLVEVLPGTSARLLSDAAPGPTVAFAQWNLSPSSGWVRADSWRWADPAWDSIVSPIAVTAKAASGLSLRETSKPMSFSYIGGPINACAQTCSPQNGSTMPRRVLFATRQVLVAAKKSTAVAFSPPPLDLRKLSYDGTAIDVTYKTPWHVHGVIRAAGPIAIAFRTRRDRGWAFTGLPVVSRATAGGDLNAWIVDAEGSGAFDITYRPQNRFFLAMALELVLYCGLLVFITRRIRYF